MMTDLKMISSHVVAAVLSCLSSLVVTMVLALSCALFLSFIDVRLVLSFLDGARAGHFFCRRRSVVLCSILATKKQNTRFGVSIVRVYTPNDVSSGDAALQHTSTRESWVFTIRTMLLLKLATVNILASLIFGGLVECTRRYLLL